MLKTTKVKEETHQKMKVFIAENRFKSFDDAINELLDYWELTQ